MIDFTKGIPIWPIGRQGGWNQVVGFYASLMVTDVDAGNIVLRITAADCYRVWLNGAFLAYGPARTAHGYTRVDEWPLDGLVKPGVNHIAIEVSSVGIDSYAYALHDPFLQAEILQAEKPLLATGGEEFAAYLLKERIQKVERYSKQRPFAEAYKLSARCNDWRIGHSEREPVTCETVGAYKLLPRHVPLPAFQCVSPVRGLERGSVIHSPGPESLLQHASRVKVGERVGGYPVEAFEIDMRKELLNFGFVPSHQDESLTNTDDQIHERVSAGEYATYDFSSVQAGFIEAKLSCEATTRVYLQFDETLNRTREEQFDLGIGAVALDLEPGEHNFSSMEPYSMSYVRIIACDASVLVHDIRIREYAHPLPEPMSLCNDSELDAIFRAGWQTFRTNSVDLFTDCVSRERGGYPCDSYFTARAELALTGESRVERNFLENYFLVDSFASIPPGMVPHCYPSDRLGKGQYIPNWGLWLVLELCEYCLRTGDEALQNLAKPRVEALFGWFSEHRNDIGLLENLPGWIFVEWSDVNQYTDGVSHPTNMLYSYCLTKAAELYGDQGWLDAGRQTRDAVLQESWDGKWFADQSMRIDGLLQRTNVRSETCQYHALFFDIVPSEISTELWQRLLSEWGPARNVMTEYEELIPAELLYGLMLRFDLLRKAKERELLLSEIRHVFGPMARQTGTLWEHVQPKASFNHGFASFTCALLKTIQTPESEAKCSRPYLSLFPDMPSYVERLGEL